MASWPARDGRSGFAGDVAPGPSCRQASRQANNPSDTSHAQTPIPLSKKTCLLCFFLQEAMSHGRLGDQSAQLQEQVAALLRGHAPDVAAARQVQQRLQRQGRRQLGRRGQGRLGRRLGAACRTLPGALPSGAGERAGERVQHHIAWLGRGLGAWFPSFPRPKNGQRPAVACIPTVHLGPPRPCAPLVSPPPGCAGSTCAALGRTSRTAACAPRRRLASTTRTRKTAKTACGASAGAPPLEGGGSPRSRRRDMPPPTLTPAQTASTSTRHTPSVAAHLFRSRM